MANKCKIPNEHLDYIRVELSNGYTFSEIAKRYGCKAYTVQKRLNIYHPISGKNTADIWNVYPQYMNVVKAVYKRYKFIPDPNIYDILIDYIYSININTINKLKSCSDNKSKYWLLYGILRSKFYTLYCKKYWIDNINLWRQKNE